MTHAGTAEPNAELDAHDPLGAVHGRRNPLTGEWVLVSPHRLARPWQGASESPSRRNRPAHDPECYLCPGTTRTSGLVNPDYTGTYAFDNDTPALLSTTTPSTEWSGSHPLLTYQPRVGTARVLCYSHRHDASMATLSAGDALAAVHQWSDETSRLGSTWNWVQIFENRGAAMGASSPHPHCQAWATDHLPNTALAEDHHQREWHGRHGRTLLGTYADLESDAGDRVVLDADTWIAVVPWWAVWPFETLVVPRRPIARLDGATSAEQSDLARLLVRLTGGYDRVFDAEFPYSMGWHQAPMARGHEHWVLHAHFYPPLLRSASVRKWMVGYELLSEPQRDLTPEVAAERLREAIRRLDADPRS